MALYAIGDVQGCARTFKRLLKRIKFKPKRDRLWLVGDLVNRGPDSVAVLRRVRDLGAAATTVLGNHDLHLLAAAAGHDRYNKADTFHDVLDARDCDELIDWLRQQPLLHFDADENRVLVHAGIPPNWSVKQALTAATKVEKKLRGKKWTTLFDNMYGDEPVAWSDGLSGEERRRYTINGLTRMRFCYPNGDLDLDYSGPPGQQPNDLVPWFDVPQRRARKTQIIFGHWAALGLFSRRNLVGLDSGCVWGGDLSAMPLDPPGDPVRVKCRRFML